MKKSSFIEGTLIATVAIFIVKILGMLYVIPFYAMVGIQGSALYAYAYNIYAIFLDISTSGLPLAISKIIGEYDALGKMEAKNRAYQLGKKILAFVAISVFMILVLFAEQIATLLLGDLSGGNTVEDVTLAIRFVSLAILIVPFLSVSKGYLQGHNVIDVSAKSQVIEQIVRIAVILIGSFVILNLFHLSVRTAVCFAVTGAFFGGLVAYVYVLKKMKTYKKELGIGSSFKKDHISNREIIKKIILYAIPFIIINTIYSFYNFIDMVFILRTMDYLGMSTLDVEFITTSITTWSGKISMIISSVALGMTMSLIPTIVTAFTKKDFHEVSQKFNKALQMIILISLPMAVGLSLLSKPVWNIFYGLHNNYGAMILSIVVFVTLLVNIFMIISSTLQGLNKFKLVYKSAIIGVILNAILDIPMMLLFDKIGFPAFLGASVASIIGYSFSSIYALYHLKKEYQWKYDSTLKVISKLIIPIIFMVGSVVILKLVLPLTYHNKISSIFYVAIITIIGGFVYLFMIHKNGVLRDVLGDTFYQKMSKFLPILKKEK